MKTKKIVKCITTLAMAAVIVIGSVMTASAKSLDKTDVKEIAYIDAGVSEEQVTVDSLIKYRDGKTSHLYKFVFHTETDKYVYKIDAESGEIKLNQSTTKSTTNDKKGINTSNELVEADEVKAIVLSYYNISESMLLDESIKLTQKNGVWIYKVKFTTNDGSKYQVEVNADTNEIVNYETKINIDSLDSNVNDPFIGEDKALSIVLSKINISDSSINKQNVKIDSDQKVWYYKVEIKTNSDSKYEYKINAATGDVIESKSK